MSVPKRGLITNRVITELNTSGFPVGDNSSPQDPYGWQGEPGASDSTFIPYLGVTPLAGSLQRTQDMRTSQAEWVFPYSVWVAGISRMQSEALADRVRGRLVAIAREVLEDDFGNWKIQQIRCISIGNNTRVGSTFPDYYTQNDTFEVWVSKER